MCIWHLHTASIWRCAYFICILHVQRCWGYGDCCNGHEGNHIDTCIYIDAIKSILCVQLRGMYTARQLSFTGVTFDIRDVPLGEKFIEMYDSSVEMVRRRLCVLASVCVMDLFTKYCVFVELVLVSSYVCHSL